MASKSTYSGDKLSVYGDRSTRKAQSKSLRRHNDDLLTSYDGEHHLTSKSSKGRKIKNPTTKHRLEQKIISLNKELEIQESWLFHSLGGGLFKESDLRESICKINERIVECQELLKKVKGN